MSPPPSRRQALCCALLSIFFITATASGQEAPERGPAIADPSWRGPLGSRNQTPIALWFLYLTPERAQTLPKGVLELGVGLDYSNIILDQRTESESELVRFDLEYLRTLFSVKRGFGRGVELGVSIPFYAYYGGFLDPVVSGFHEALGLPNFLRGQTPNGLVDYQYRRDGQVVLSGEKPFSAVGDISVIGKKEVLRRGRSALSLRGALKLPTGEPQRLSGSGAADLGMGLSFDRIGDRFGIYGAASYHLLGDSEELDTKDFFSFMMGADWRFKPSLAAVLQADYHRPPLSGGLPLLNAPGAQIALGLRWRYSERFLYEWRFVEDLSSFSPDFTIAFEVGIRLQRAPR